MDDDLAFPEEIDFENIEAQEIADTRELQIISRYPIEIDVDPQTVTEKDFDYLGLNDLEKKVLITELSDCDMYLRNIHSGFKFATSINSLIKLVGAGIGVHKHRRHVLTELKGKAKSPGLTIDPTTGEVIS